MAFNIESAIIHDELITPTPTKLRPTSLRRDVFVREETAAPFHDDILTFFEQSALPLTNDEGKLLAKNGAQHPAKEYWESIGVKQEAIDEIVDERSQFKFRISDEEIEALVKLSVTSPLAAAHRLIDNLKVFYDNNDRPLHDSIRSTDTEQRVNGSDGMNTHNRFHVTNVAIDAERFLTQAEAFRDDITPQTHQEAALSSAGHDSGQMIQREGQEDASVYIMEHGMPYLVQNYPLLWRAIKRAILIHPEANFKRLAEEVWHTTNDTAATIQRMHEELTPAELVMALSDKWDIGQHRLPNIWTNPDGIVRDGNIGPNLFTVKNKGYSNDGTIFHVEMQYNHGLVEKYFSQINSEYAHTNHPAVKVSKRYKDGRLLMPEAIDQYLRDGIASHSEVLEAMMWGNKEKKIGYRKRLRLAIMLAFALNPKTKFVDITISDEDAKRGLNGILSRRRIRQIQTRHYRFTPEGLDAQLDAIEQKFATQGINVVELNEIGKRLRPTAPIEAA